MSAQRIVRIMFLALMGILGIAIVFLVYAILAGQVEASRVEAAIKRDCSVDLEVNPDEIDEPGDVFMNYEIGGTPMKLIC